MQNITFYITGHGYGHATRSLEIIKNLMQADASLFFHIRTNVPEWQFKINLTNNYKLYSSPIDMGATQKNIYSVNKLATLEHAQKVYSKKDELIEQEVEFIRETDSKIILSDIPPIAFDVARAMNIPGIGITNFSWDWIYESYLGVYPEYENVVAEISASYGKADLLLRLPFNDGLTAFPTIQDIPLVARKPKQPKEVVWGKLGLKADTQDKLVLIALRPEDVSDIDFDKLSEIQNVKFIGSGLTNKDNCLNVPLDFTYFPDLVNASDIVASKPGYGVVSEIIALQKPLIYTSRADFPEYEILVAGLKEKAISYFLSSQDFFAGNWEDAILNLLNHNENWPPITLNGAETAAEIILDKIKNGNR